VLDLISPSKLVGETFTLTFNFLDRLNWAEVLTSAVCTVEVASGTDLSPEDILSGTDTISSDGTSATQKVYRGVPGVIYKVICTASSSTHTYVKISYLAVLPDDDAAVPLLFLGQIETVEMTSGA
jgi:hypothetical protein